MTKKRDSIENLRATVKGHTPLLGEMFVEMLDTKQRVAPESYFICTILITYLRSIGKELSLHRLYVICRLWIQSVGNEDVLLLR